MHFTGPVALNEAYIRLIRDELTIILPLLLILTMAVLTVMLGSARAAVLTLPVAVLATLASFGVAGLMGAKLAAINAFAPIMVLCIGIAGCVHMSHSYTRKRIDGMQPVDAAVAAVEENRNPMCIAHGTTALGFFGLAFSPSPPVRLVGYIVGGGIFVALILSLTLLPFLLAVLDAEGKRDWTQWRVFESTARVAQSHARLVVATFTLLTIPALWVCAEQYNQRQRTRLLCRRSSIPAGHPPGARAAQWHQ